MNSGQGFGFLAAALEELLLHKNKHIWVFFSYAQLRFICFLISFKNEN